MVWINTDITEELIRRELEEKNIKAGIDEDAVRTLPYRAQYGMEYTVAQGKIPEKGTPGYYEFFFDKDAFLNDKDHTEFARKGTVLAVYHPAKNGAYGFTVFATMIAPKPQPDCDELQLINVERIDNDYVAEKDGEISFDGTRLGVFSLMNLTEERLRKLGKVDFDGDIKIEGDVPSDVTVTAAGNIEVDGVVEGAELVAGKDIIISYGVHGQGTAKLTAGGNVEAKFIEEATVFADDLIRADSLINVEAKCGNTIVVTGKTGRILGGYLVAERCIDAMTVGNEQLSYTGLAVKSDDPEKIRMQAIIVREKLIGRTIIEFGDERIENPVGSGVEFHLTDKGIQQFEIGKYIYPKRIEKEEDVYKPLVLLVDDDPVVLKKEYMDLHKKYRVTAISKPIDALIYLKKKRPDLILLDYKMPEMSGTELFARIRKMEGCANIPVYFLTGVSSKEVVVECLSMYPQGYLLKPMSKEELLKVVGDFFRDNPVE